MMLTTSLVEYGYCMSAWSARSRSSPKAPTKRLIVSSGTSGPYDRRRAISDSTLGLSMAWQLKRSPEEKTHVVDAAV